MNRENAGMIVSVVDVMILPGKDILSSSVSSGTLQSKTPNLNNSHCY